MHKERFNSEEGHPGCSEARSDDIAKGISQSGGLANQNYSTNSGDYEKRRAEMDQLRKGLLTRLTSVYKGVKSLFFGKQPVEEPARPEPEVEQPKIPLSVLTFKLFRSGPHGPSIICSEVRGMADKGYLVLVEQGNQTILVPTQKFAETVYKAQQAQRRSA